MTTIMTIANIVTIGTIENFRHVVPKLNGVTTSSRPRKRTLFEWPTREHGKDGARDYAEQNRDVGDKTAAPA